MLSVSYEAKEYDVGGFGASGGGCVCEGMKSDASAGEYIVQAFKETEYMRIRMFRAAAVANTSWSVAYVPA